MILSEAFLSTVRRTRIVFSHRIVLLHSMLYKWKYSSMNLHKLAYVHHHSMHIRRHMLRWVDVGEHTYHQTLDFCSNSLLVCTDRSQGRTDNNLLIFKSFRHGVCTSSLLSISGKVTTIIFTFSNKSSFSGPVRVRH